MASIRAWLPEDIEPQRVGEVEFRNRLTAEVLNRIPTDQRDRFVCITDWHPYLGSPDKTAPAKRRLGRLPATRLTSSARHPSRLTGPTSDSPRVVSQARAAAPIRR
jgi:hypothetical protein